MYYKLFKLCNLETFLFWVFWFCFGSLVILDKVCRCLSLFFLYKIQK